MKGEQQETNSIITHYAFSVPDHLLGMPLAMPWKRFLAIVIDLFVVGILSLLGGTVMLGVLSVIVLVWMRRHQTSLSHLTKAFLIFSQLILWAVLVILLVSKSATGIDRIGNGVAATVAITEIADCGNDVPCWHSKIPDLASAIEQANVLDAEQA